jgi:6-phosphogluconolactonase
MERIVCDANDLPARAAARIAQMLTRALGKQHRASLALAGGTTPRATYECLAGLSLPWARIDFFFGDERCVPPDDADSNYRLVRAALFEPAQIPELCIHRMRGEEADHELAARAYEAELPNELDVVVLGIGEDAHTASLFPGSPALNECERRVVPVIGPKPPPARLTLTPPALRASGQFIVLASGTAKAEAVRKALKDPLDLVRVPAQIARDGVWLLDAQAAALL